MHRRLHRLRRRSWPDSSGQVNDKFAHHNCWELAGEAEAIWEKAHPYFMAILNADRDEVTKGQSSCLGNLAVEAIMMQVGNRRSNVQPTAIVLHKDKKIRRKVVKLLEDGGFYRKAPGFRLIEDPSDPQSLGAIGGHPAHAISSRVSIVSIDKCGHRIMFDGPGSTTASATLGGFVRCQGTLYGLTVAHARCVANDTTIDRSKQCIESTPKLHYAFDDKNEHLTNIDTDWSLITMPKWDVDASYRGRFSEVKDIYRGPPIKKDVYVRSSSKGRIEGEMLGSISLMCLAPSTKFQAVWQVKLKQPLEKGDSGTWVVGCEDDMLYSIIVAAAPGSLYHYTLPAATVFNSIVQQLGSQVDLLTPTYEEGRNWSVSTTYCGTSSSEESGMSLSTCVDSLCDDQQELDAAAHRHELDANNRDHIPYHGDS